MTQTIFQVQSRTEVKPKVLRQKGIVPGNIFGADGSLAVQMTAKNFRKLYEEEGETGLIYLQIDQNKKQRPTLIDEVQVDPVNGNFIHVTFKQVNLSSKITAEIPVEVIGKFDVNEATLVVVKDQIEVEALPTDLPEKFEIDVARLTAIGQTVAYKDLNYDRSKVTLILGEEGEEEPVVIVQEQREEEPEEAPAPVEGEGAEGVEGATAEGETAGEGKAEDGEQKPADAKAPADKKPAGDQKAPAK